MDIKDNVIPFQISTSTYFNYLQISYFRIVTSFSTCDKNNVIILHN